MRLERRGECNNCGWCCQFISILRLTVPERDVNVDSAKFYEMRGGVVGDDGKIRTVMHAFMPCAAHDKNNKQCSIYRDRPKICQTFPTQPDQIEGSPCSYWFEVIDDNDEVVERRGGLDSEHPSPPRFGG